MPGSYPGGRGRIRCARQALRTLLARAAAEPRFSRLHAYPPMGDAPSNALCRRHGFTLVDTEDLDHRGRTFRCNVGSPDPPGRRGA